MSHPVFTGISRAHLGGLIEELAPAWRARRESALRERRGGERRRATGAGRKHELVFTDRVLVTLVHLRAQLPHAALAELYSLGRSTVTEAIGEIRPLLADRGFAVPDRPGLRLRTLADGFAYADAEGVKLRIDGTETQVRRPKAHHPGRCAFVSGKKKQNTIKTITISDHQGRTLWSGADRPGRMHDQTPRTLRSHPPGRRQPDLGPRRPAAHPAQAEHRTRARQPDGLLYHLPAEPPGQHASTSTADKAVIRRHSPVPDPVRLTVLVQHRASALRPAREVQPVRVQGRVPVGVGGAAVGAQTRISSAVSGCMKGPSSGSVASISSGWSRTVPVPPVKMYSCQAGSRHSSSTVRPGNPWSSFASSASWARRNAAARSCW
ncbi:transposase family protein [Streptomyces sp. NPDC005706]|uniref:transposase family protein n=1 Tax=Streptomyces sp. NPDC005706 TaxID=3157169 RepID=UPI0033D29B0B